MSKLTIPTLNDGEIYIGAIGNHTGDAYHLILLSGDNDDATWECAMEWARSIGGDLPDRVEQALLYKHMPEEFKNEAYWSNEKHADDANYAWCQHFNGGGQYGLRKGLQLRARAVRRVAIKEE